ncbi:MAG: hypothetical protein KAZ88_07225 [Acidimicrobiia bacterium]|nr:hypothetical protein [Acidimicrobiia bacterium]MBP8180767.1 hypothetical protein [Acidimicrobiia bacterium]
MKTFLWGAGLGILALIAVAVKGDILSFHSPFGNLSDVVEETTSVEQAQTATVTQIEPIALDCRARIHAVIPITAKREHSVMGQVYRTDTVTLDAIGDIDTCVEAGSTTITTMPDGRVQVVVPAQAIHFERPRVDAVATAGSFDFDKGAVGKATDVLPWVDDNSSLAPVAYAYAQSIIGSSECLYIAFDRTVEALKLAYVNQLAAQGVAAEQVNVTVLGRPEVGPTPPATVGAVRLQAAQDRAVCKVAPGAVSAA